MYIFGHLLCWNLKRKLQDGQNETGKVNKLDVGNKKDHSGVARAFPSGRRAHVILRAKFRTRKWEKPEEKYAYLIQIWAHQMRKVELLSPTRDCEAGYDPESTNTIRKPGYA